MLHIKRRIGALSALSILAAILSQTAGAEDYTYQAKPDRPAVAPGTCPPGWRPATPPLNPALGCLPDTLYLPIALGGSVQVPPGRCPEGWEHVTPPRNPMLICKPKDLTAAPVGPRLGRVDPGCPDGWRAVTPPFNRALICLPDQIVATLPPTGPGVPPGQCPDGWWRVTAPLNPVLGCLPDTIVTPGVNGTSPEQPGPYTASGTASAG